MLLDFYKTQGLSLYPKVKNNSIAVIIKSQNNIHKIKEGTIVVVDTPKSAIGHISLGIIYNGDGKEYIATAPLRFPRIDSLNPVQRFKGIISFVVMQDGKANKIKTATPPFILLITRSLLSLSYFICGFIYLTLTFDYEKVKKIYNIMVDDIAKWCQIWVSYALRRL